jgi:hypothetical protein
MMAIDYDTKRRNEMIGNVNQTACKVKEPISVDVANYATRLADRAQRIAEDMSIKLQPVMVDAMPQEGNKRAPDENYPPLFSDLRNSFQGIENALDKIEDALLRTAL